MTTMLPVRPAFERPPQAHHPAHALEAIGRPPAVGRSRFEPEGAAELASHLADAGRPLLMFGQQGCEFCGAVRRLCQAIGATLHIVDLDDPQRQATGQAQALRAALRAHCGAPMLPQLFIRGRHLGGGTAALDAWNDGRLAKCLRRAGVAFRADVNLDARSLIPGWVQAF